MIAAGLDIGSTTSELVLFDSEVQSVILSEKFPTTPEVRSRSERLLQHHPHDRLVVTGYGRTLGELHFDAASVTEIRAVARGAAYILPGCKTVLDIGGQDTKVVRLNGNGRVENFEMNDRCAAGAGRFLEMMARVLSFDLSEFGEAAEKGNDGLILNSMCAVFAESEVVGLMTQGRNREDIARAVHKAIAARTLAMLERLGSEPPLLFVGGAARNPFLVRLLQDALDFPVSVPEDPQMISALGAALIAASS